MFVMFTDRKSTFVMITIRMGVGFKGFIMCKWNKNKSQHRYICETKNFLQKKKFALMKIKSDFVLYRFPTKMLSFFCWKVCVSCYFTILSCIIFYSSMVNVSIQMPNNMFSYANSMLLLIVIILRLQYPYYFFAYHRTYVT